jgi:membrane-bound serine protease (ClpP class)
MTVGWPIVLTLVGFVFVVAEVFFPSLGMFGLIAAGAIVTADVLAWQHSAALMWALVAVQVVLVPLLLKGAFAVLPRLPFGRAMLLPAPPPQGDSGVEPGGHLLGLDGVALTDLRPSGTAQVGEERRTVVAENGTIGKGTTVKVVAVEGYRIVVRPAGE